MTEDVTSTSATDERRRADAATVTKELIFHRVLLPSAKRNANRPCTTDAATGVTHTYAEHVPAFGGHIVTVPMFEPTAVMRAVREQQPHFTVMVPSDDWGEAVHAVVVLREGAEASEVEIIDHARESIAGYEVPEAVTFRAEPLPLSGAMKVLKRELRAPYWDGHDRNVG